MVDLSWNVAVRHVRTGISARAQTWNVNGNAERESWTFARYGPRENEVAVTFESRFCDRRRIVIVAAVNPLSYTHRVIKVILRRESCYFKGNIAIYIFAPFPGDLVYI